MTEKTKVLYILGQGRSGTTLLDRLLGQIDGFFSSGEIALLWKWGFDENCLCGCGETFRQCPFWARVIERGFGSPPQVNVAQMLRMDPYLLRSRHIPRLVFSGERTPFGGELAACRRTLAKLYGAVREVSGARWIVDSSKNPLYSLVLKRVADVEMHVVHLVRDSRAVAHSWLRKRLRPEVHWKESLMDIARPTTSARAWMYVNMLTHLFRPLYKHYTLLRYEDLVAHPREVLTGLCATLGEPKPSLDFLEATQAHLDANHTVAGNPMRFAQGPVTIRPDVEWKQKMSKGRQWLISALTFPLLQAYGYSAPGSWLRRPAFDLTKEKSLATPHVPQNGRTSRTTQLVTECAKQSAT